MRGERSVSLVQHVDLEAFLPALLLSLCLPPSLSLSSLAPLFFLFLLLKIKDNYDCQQRERETVGRERERERRKKQHKARQQKSFMLQKPRLPRLSISVSPRICQIQGQPGAGGREGEGGAGQQQFTNDYDKNTETGKNISYSVP